MAYTFIDHPGFTPELSPLEMFTLGAFGGGYFRPIYSAINQETYEGDYKQFQWTRQLDLHKLTNVHYDVSVNRYKAKCGFTLEQWQDKKWIHPQDPRGWVQWYCRFFEGRRTDDDLRQINRWRRIVRFKNMLIKKPTNKIKQVLLHWAYDPELGP